MYPLVYHRGGHRLKGKFSYMLGDERVVLKQAEARVYLVACGLDEQAATDHLKSIKSVASKPTKAYEYHCKPPVWIDLGSDVAVATPAVVAQYFRDSNKYANEMRAVDAWLLGVENLIYEWYGSVSQKIGRQRALLEEQVTELEDVINRERSKARKRVRLESEKSRLKELRQRCRELRAAERDAKRCERDDKNGRVATMLAKARAKADAAKNKLNTSPQWSHLAHGTRGARRRDTSIRKGGRVRFIRTMGDSRLESAQSGGMPVPDLFALKYTTGWARIIKPKRERVTIGKHWGHAPTILLLRIGTVAGTTKPLWAAFPIKLHRDIPPYAQLKVVCVKKQREGLKDEYSACFVVESSQGFESGLSGDGVAGVDLGWRRLPNGDLRVAAWRDTYGAGQLVLPAHVLNFFRKAEDIQSIRDTNMNEVVASFKAWREDQALPEWLAEKTSHIHAWQSIDRLRNLVATWERFYGDEHIYATLLAWRNRDSHLAAYAYGLRRSAQNIRRELYRRFAAFLRHHNKVVGLENANWSKLARSAAVEADAEGQVPRWQMRVASPGLLRQYIQQKCQCLLVESAGTTRTCAECGYVNGAVSSDMLQACEECGAQYDRDTNAAENIWRQVWEKTVRDNLGLREVNHFSMAKAAATTSVA